MEYGKIIRRALSISWHYKVLWIFGIALAIFGGSYHPSNMLRYTINQGDIQRWRYSMPWLLRAPFAPGSPLERMPFGRLANNVGPAIFGLLALILMIGLVFLVIGTIVRYTSQGALVGMVDQVERMEKISFKSGLSKGWSRFLRLFAIGLLIGVFVLFLMLALVAIIAVGVAIVAGPAILSAQGGNGPNPLTILWAVGAGLVSVLLFILILLAVSAWITLWHEYAIRICVLESRGIFDSLRAGWALVRSRLREGLLMWLLMLGIDLAVGLLTIPLALVGAGGILAPALAVGGVTGSKLAGMLFALPGLLAVIIVASVLGGVYLTFNSAVWTLTYRELRNKPEAVASGVS